MIRIIKKYIVLSFIFPCLGIANENKLYFKERSDLGFEMTFSTEVNDLNREYVYKNIFLGSPLGSFLILENTWDKKDPYEKLEDVINKTSTTSVHYLDQMKNDLEKGFKKSESNSDKCMPIEGKVFSNEQLKSEEDKTGTYILGKDELAEISFWSNKIDGLENIQNKKEIYLKLMSFLDSIQYIKSDKVKNFIYKKVNLLKDELSQSNLVNLLKNKEQFEKESELFKNLVVLSVIENKRSNSLSKDEMDLYLFNLFISNILLVDKETVFLKGVFYIENSSLKSFSEKIKRKVQNSEILKKIRSEGSNLQNKICSSFPILLNYSCEERVKHILSEGLK